MIKAATGNYPDILSDIAKWYIPEVIIVKTGDHRLAEITGEIALLYAWLNIAAAAGDEESAKTLSQYETFMTPDQIQQGQAKTRSIMAAINVE